MNPSFDNLTLETLETLGIKELNSGASTGTSWLETSGDISTSYSPINGMAIARVKNAGLDDYELIMSKAASAYEVWKGVPPPLRGEIVRQIGMELRKYKKELGRIVSLEMGKILVEGQGEVQEMIDICDFAVGQSRQLYGFTMASERPNHRMFEQYHPVGILGLITSFNFPVAVWSWNAMLAAVAGDVIIWKPSSKTPLAAIATQNIISSVLEANNIPEGVFNLIIARSSVLGDNFVDDRRIPLISLTGSTEVGKHVGGIVGNRLGKIILELGGNNAIIISNKADLDLAIPAIVFGAVGTAGQRCTSTRRLIIQEEIYPEVVKRLTNAYEQIVPRIGNPLDENTLVGPLVDQSAVKAFINSMEDLKKEGGRIIFGGEILNGQDFESGLYVVPALAEAKNNYPIVQKETFAPLLYLLKYQTIEEAIFMNNSVPQGLSSSIFTTDIRESELFLSQAGSDCGIANVNIGTSGAEIGGAFGGEKDTGGGRESGSDAWKAYMRRQTNTINYGNEIPLAQGIEFRL
jgi:aldehyde dehydrogenase (NAD+)